MEHRAGSGKGYRDLVAWQKGIELAETICRVTQQFPTEERYGLVSQMRRATVSIPSNIAEGQLRNSQKEFMQFISIALGSCGELYTQLELGRRLGYIAQENFNEIPQAVSELMKILHGLRRKIRKHA